MANVFGEFWDSKGTTVPLAGGLEDSVLQGLKMLQKRRRGAKNSPVNCFLPGNPRQGFPANFLFFQIHFFAPTIDKEPFKANKKYLFY